MIAERQGHAEMQKILQNTNMVQSTAMHAASSTALGSGVVAAREPKSEVQARQNGKEKVERSARPMQTIRLLTWVDAPVERCFQLSLSVALHCDAACVAGEKAISGVTEGLMGPGEQVTWQGKHYGLKLKHTSLIDGWRPYSYFRDVMVDGVFARFEHEHHFAAMDDGTRIRDEVRFSSRLGWPGRLVERFVMRRHLTAILSQRNAYLKQVAEGEEWKAYLLTDQQIDAARVEKR